MRRLRAEARATTSAMAAFAGVKSRKTIEKWEKGISTPNLDHILSICVAMDLCPSKLIAFYRSRRCHAEKPDFSLMRR